MNTQTKPLGDTPAAPPLDPAVPGSSNFPIGPGRRLSLLHAALKDFIGRHRNLLWWLHSAYAFALGIFVMWLGSRRFAYLRIVVFDIAFIWITSLFLPTIANSPRLPAKWQGRVRLVINYFNKNFYQQLLFFVLPLDYASATLGSRNMLFVGLLALSAVLSTMDIVYDRYVSVRWPLTALFFAFNLFACINVMLPVLWGVSNYWALWISAILALAGFASILYQWSGRRGAGAKLALAAAAIGLSLVIYYFRSFIPPAPLRLVDAEFGRSIKGLAVMAPIDALPAPGSGKIAGLTAIKAPLGLLERVRHAWYLDGKLLYASPYYPVTGGREEGYRIWTQITWKDNFQGATLVLEGETRGGQLIGRATFPKR